jgi:opacity protein-like surface antigen
MMKDRSAAILLAACVPAGFASAAQASGPDFGYLYTADIAERGETELSLWATDRRGKGDGHYTAQDYRFEVERGISEHFQVSGYANFASHHVRGLDGEFERVDRDFALQGLSAEFKFRLVDPSKKGFGLAFYVEPGWARIATVTGARNTEYEFELKAIVEKDVVPDRLVWAANLTLEPEWEREREVLAPGVVEQSTEKELGVEFASGLSYKVTPKWWLGVEGRYHSVYPDWMHGLHRENYAVYAGPSMFYDGGKWSLTATWQPQLFGGPHAPGSSLEFEDHEKREFRAKLSYEF